MSSLVRQNAVRGRQNAVTGANTVPEHNDAMLAIVNCIVLPLQECEGRSKSTVELRRKQLKAMCDWYANNHDDPVAIKELFSARTVKEFCEGTGRAGSVPDYCKACAFTLEKLGGAGDEVSALTRCRRAPPLRPRLTKLTFSHPRPRCLQMLRARASTSWLPGSFAEYRNAIGLCTHGWF